MNETNAPFTVFLVDDDQFVRDSLSAVIEVSGYRVQCFVDAEQLLEGIEKESPGLLVVDVRLPGMSGLELLQQLASAGLMLPCVLMTGHADVEASELDFWQGEICVLHKPCPPEQLLEFIRGAASK